LTRRPERNFFEQLKRNLPKQGFRLDLQRIENVTTNGTPDVNYCIEGDEGWVELKAWERVRLSGRFTVPKLREEQAAWLLRRGKVGGRAHLLLRINKDVVLIDGRLAPALFDKSLHLDWADGEKIATTWLKYPVDWLALIGALRKPLENQAVIDLRLSLFRTRVGSSD
jgi:hypothetical protein